MFYEQESKTLPFHRRFHLKQTKWTTMNYYVIIAMKATQILLTGFGIWQITTEIAATRLTRIWKKMWVNDLLILWRFSLTEVLFQGRNESVYTCIICSTVLLSAAEWARHLKMWHTDMELAKANKMANRSKKQRSSKGSSSKD